MILLMDWKAHFAGEPTLAALLSPRHLVSAAGTTARSGGAPKKSGIYAWYFDAIPSDIDASGCHRHEEWTLLYTGISPRKPSANGRPPSRSHIHKRLRTHFGGNAAGSTLRLTLGCLLEQEIGTVLQRVGTSSRLTFTNPGEQLLDGWLHRHARVVWAEHPTPWEPEHQLLASGLPLPLNIDKNPCKAFTTRLSALRKAARQHAETLPLIGDSGGPRRLLHK